MDVAVLGIKVDSTQAVAATTALDKFAAAAKPAAAGASAIEKAASGAAAATASLAQATGKSEGQIRAIQAAAERAGVSFSEMNARHDAAGVKIVAANAAAAQSLAGVTAAAKPAAQAATGLERAAAGASKSTTAIAQSGGLARHELINLSRQIQDVGVSLTSGQSPFMVLAQQGTQIADIFGSSKTATVGGAIKQVTTAIGNFLTPARLLAGGVALAGAAAYVAYGQWKSFALALDDTAKQAGVTTGEMAKLQAVASFKGISDEDFTKGITSFSQQVYLAKQNAGGLLDVFRANGQQVGTFTGSLEKAADLIQRASSDQQRLVLLGQMGLPANMQWVRLLEQGSAGLNRLKGQTGEFGNAANDNMVQKAREFDEAWNKTWTNWGLQAKGAVVGAASLLDTLILKGRQGLMAAGVDVGGNLLRNGMGTALGGVGDDFYKAVGAKGRTDPNATKDPNAVKNAIAQESSYVAILDKSLTPAQLLAEMQKKLRDAGKTKGANDERKQHRNSAAA